MDRQKDEALRSFSHRLNHAAATHIEPDSLPRKRRRVTTAQAGSKKQLKRECIRAICEFVFATSESW